MNFTCLLNNTCCHFGHGAVVALPQMIEFLLGKNRLKIKRNDRHQWSQLREAKKLTTEKNVYLQCQHGINGPT